MGIGYISIFRVLTNPFLAMFEATSHIRILFLPSNDVVFPLGLNWKD